MANSVYRRVMESARRAARTGKDVNLVAPPVGRLRDAFMAEYNRCVALATKDGNEQGTDVSRGTGEAQ